MLWDLALLGVFRDVRCHDPNRDATTMPRHAGRRICVITSGTTRHDSIKGTPRGLQGGSQGLPWVPRVLSKAKGKINNAGVPPPIENPRGGSLKESKGF